MLLGATEWNCATLHFSFITWFFSSLQFSFVDAMQLMILHLGYLALETASDKACRRFICSETENLMTSEDSEE